MSNERIIWDRLISAGLTPAGTAGLMGNLQASFLACVHAFVGKLADGSVAAVQTLPWNHRGWHAASGPKGSANDGYISFEMCEDGLTDPVCFDQVYQAAVAAGITDGQRPQSHATRQEMFVARGRMGKMG